MSKEPGAQQQRKAEEARRARLAELERALAVRAARVIEDWRRRKQAKR